MGNESNEPGDGKPEGTVDDMMQHLEAAKAVDRSATARARRSATGSALQNEMRRRSDAAVLAGNHEARLEEIVANDAVTHRSGKPWKSAKIGVEARGRLPVYYRLDGMITHTAYITDIVIDPDEDVAAEKFVDHITDADTYSEYFDMLDTTTFIVRDGQRLENPFPQTELEMLSGDGTVDENYSRQPAYVVQRPGDFPDAP